MATDPRDWEPRGIMSFTLALHSKIVVLTDGSRIPIQGIGTITTTLLFFYHLSFTYLVFLNLLSVSKIIRVLNCTVIFFLTHCVF